MQFMPNNKEEYRMMPVLLINVITLYISLELLLMKGKQKFPLTKHFPAPLYFLALSLVVHIIHFAEQLHSLLLGSY